MVRRALFAFSVLLGVTVLPVWAARTNRAKASNDLRVGGPTGWLTTDSGKRYRFVSMGTATQPHTFMIGGHDVREVKSISWTDCCDVEAVLRDDSREEVNDLQIKDVYVSDGATVMMSYGADGLPVTVISPATRARKVMRFPNLQGIKSIRFDPVASTQRVAVKGHQHGGSANSGKPSATDSAATASAAISPSQSLVSDGTTMQCGSLRQRMVEPFYSSFAVATASRPRKIDVYICPQGDNDCANPWLAEEGDFDSRGRLVRHHSRYDTITWRYTGASVAPVEKVDTETGLYTTTTRYKRSAEGYVLGEWITTKYPPKSRKQPITTYQPGASIRKNGDEIVVTETFDHVPGMQGAQRITRIYSGGLLRSSTLPMPTFAMNRQTGHIEGISTQVQTYHCKYERLADGARSTTELVEAGDGQFLPQAKTVFNASGRPILDVMVMGTPGSPGTTVKSTMYYYLTADEEGNWTQRKECRNGRCVITVRKISYWSR